MHLYRMQKIEEIGIQADLFYLHALYEFIDMITNTEVVDSHVACLSYLPCQNLHATTNETRDLFSVLLRIKVRGCCCDMLTGYYKYSFVCPDPAQFPFKNTCGVDID